MFWSPMTGAVQPNEFRVEMIVPELLTHVPGEPYRHRLIRAQRRRGERTP